MTKLLGKIIELTRRVYIKDQPNNSFCTHRFGAGKRDIINSIGVMVTEWYFHPSIKVTSNDILAIVKTKDQRFAGIDKISFYNTIERFLEENAFNKELFDVDKVAFRKVQTLFDARVKSSNTDEFAERVWKVIETKVLASIMDWLLLYPLENLKLEKSKVFCVDGVTLLSSDDAIAWNNIANKYSNICNFNLKTGKYNKRHQDISFIHKDTFSWIIVEEKGTEISVRKSAASKIRIFLSVLLSTCENRHQLLVYSSNEGIGNVHQFPYNFKSATYDYKCSHIGVLFPTFTESITISDQTLNKVYEWYQLREKSSERSLRKSIVASHYINYGINADEDLEQFIHMFIALDALFGSRGEVEKGIEFGIKETFHWDSNWSKRAKNLFDLRNELLHGGSSSISDWNKLELYEKTFQTNPLDDVLEAALSAFAIYFTLPVYKKPNLLWYQQIFKLLNDYCEKIKSMIKSWYK